MSLAKDDLLKVTYCLSLALLPGYLLLQLKALSGQGKNTEFLVTRLRNSVYLPE